MVATVDGLHSAASDAVDGCAFAATLQDLRFAIRGHDTGTPGHDTSQHPCCSHSHSDARRLPAARFIHMLHRCADASLSDHSQLYTSGPCCSIITPIIGDVLSEYHPCSDKDVLMLVSM